MGYKPPAPEAIHPPPKWMRHLPEQIRKAATTTTSELV